MISTRSSHLGRLSLSAGLGPSLRCSCRSEPLELTDAVLQQTVQGWQESAHHPSLPVSDSGVPESDCGWNGRQGQPETCPCVRGEQNCGLLAGSSNKELARRPLRRSTAVMILPFTGT